MSRQKLGEAGLLLAAGTVGVNVLQIAKLILMSAWFGASSGLLDSYFVGLNLPVAVQNIFLGALQMSFIPIYVGQLSRQEDQDSHRTLRNTLGLGFTLYISATLLLLIFADPILRAAAPGLSREEWPSHLRTFRLLILTLFTNGISDLMSAFYTAHQRFLLPSVSPIISILISIIYLVVFRSQGTDALIYGFILGSLVQAVILWICAPRLGGFVMRTGLGFVSTEYRTVFVLMSPALFSMLFAHLSIVIDGAVATTLGRGAATVLSYASRMYDVVLKLFVMSIGSVLFPYFAAGFAEKRYTEIRQTLASAIRLSLMCLVPVAIIIYAFGSELVYVILQRNRFTIQDSLAVGRTWAAYCSGAFFMAAAFFSARCLNAMHLLRPLWIGPAIGVPVNLALDLLLAHYYGVAGIGLATMLVQLFYMEYYRREAYRALKNHGALEARDFLPWKILASLLVCFAITYLFCTLFESRLRIANGDDISRKLSVLLWVTAGSLVSLTAYGALLLALKVEEVGMLLRFGKRLLLRRS